MCYNFLVLCCMVYIVVFSRHTPYSLRHHIYHFWASADVGLWKLNRETQIPFDNGELKGCIVDLFVFYTGMISTVYLLQMEKILFNILYEIQEFLQIYVLSLVWCKCLGIICGRIQHISLPTWKGWSMSISSWAQVNTLLFFPMGFFLNSWRGK